jgi:oligopeptide transport system permease protein
MAKYIIKRIFLMLITLFIIMTICFVVVRLLPFNIPVEPGVDNEFRRRAIIEAYGYDKPILVQYGIFLKRLITSFDWGVSTHYKYLAPVTGIIADRVRPTMVVNLYSLFVSIPLGIIFGVLAALKKNKATDHVISVGVMIFISVPSYVFAFVLQYYLAFKLNLLPLMVAPGTSYLKWDMFISMILPILALSFGPIATLTRYTRAELTEVLTSDFMLLARTKGLSRRQATFRHAFRNSLVPIMPIIIGNFVGILGGSLVIEQIFRIPGIGKLYIASINSRDYNLFLGVSMFYVIVGLIAALLIDLSYGLVDPRIRIGGRKSES